MELFMKSLLDNKKQEEGVGLKQYSSALYFLRRIYAFKFYYLNV